MSQERPSDDYSEGRLAPIASSIALCILGGYIASLVVLVQLRPVSVTLFVRSAPPYVTFGLVLAARYSVALFFARRSERRRRAAFMREESDQPKKARTRIPARRPKLARRDLAILMPHHPILTTACVRALTKLLEVPPTSKSPSIKLGTFKLLLCSDQGAST